MADNQQSERAALNKRPQTPDEKPATSNAVVSEESKKETDAAADDAASTPKRVSYFQLFKYTTFAEKVLLFFAILLSTAHGVVLPLFCVAFGDITSDLTPNKSVEERSRLAAYSALYMFLCAVGNMITAGLAAFFWGFVGNRLQVRLRKMYFAALTAQEIEYFDLEKAEVLSTRYLTDMRTFQSSQGKINHTMLYPVSMTVSGLVLGFVRGWWYSLIVTLLTPLVIVGMVIFVRSLGKEYAEVQKSYEQAGSVAEQALSSIRTVKTLNGEQHELSMFAKAADAARLISTKYSVVSGLSFGLFFCIIHVSYSLNLWLGAVLIDRQVTNTNMDRAYAVSDICWIFFAIINGAFAIGHTSPAAKAIMTGAEAAYRIYEVIERKPLIEIDDQTKLKPTAVKGVLEFKGVSFSYKSKVGDSTTAKLSSKPALSNISFRVNPGERVAFVGESGSGKSTTLQLLERLYDPTSGSVMVDDRDIKEYNLTALRAHIGFVTQEPVLFGLTVKENLLLAKPEASEVEIWAALKKAKADDFVSRLPKQLETYVGASGSQLSGGQKQRLCIARSLLSNPSILLLDEATSALDNKTERDLIQILLETAAERKMTTVTVAHRLATVIDSDRIYVMDDGKIVEVGTHAELVQKQGFYSKLAKIQLGEMTIAGQNINEIALESSALVPLQPSQPKSEDVKIAEEPVAPAEDETKVTEQDAKEKAIEEEKKFKEKSSSRLWGYMTGHWNLLISGCICSLCCGSMMPIFAIPLAWMIDILSQYDALRSMVVYSQASIQALRDDTTKVIIFFFVMSGVVLLVNALQVYIFTRLGQTVTSKIRIDLYRHLLTREVAFFDKPEHNTGSLTSLLSSDCLSVNSLVSSKYRAYFNGLGAFLSGSIVGLIADWRLGLVCLFFSPFIALTGLIDARTMAAESEMEAKHATQKKEPKIFQEVSTNMKTVAVINARKGLIPHFEQIIDQDYDNLKWQRLAYVSFIFGLGQFSMLATYAFSFWIGTLLMLSGSGLTFRNLFQALFGTIFGALNLGQAQQFAGNIGESQKCANRVFDMMEIKNSSLSADDTCTLEDWRVPTLPRAQVESGSPDIVFENVSFTYPGREVKALDNLSFSVSPGEKVGIAGQSGSGKSTIFALLFRFYEVQSGRILVGGKDIKSIPVSTLRAQLLGMVQQEAVLFSRTILDNIKYNLLDATDEQVVQAATVAEADSFIRKNLFEDQSLSKGEVAKDKESSLPEGYFRQLGLKGSGISGGQKQRVAIARTVLRDPRVYLFDESTSALDSATENLVQTAFNKVTVGKTSLTIAHRLSTIQNSDKILVIENGQLTEQGSYQDLAEKRGAFFQMLAH